MSIDMYLGSSDQQASSTQHVLQNHINAYQQLQTALSQFTVNSPSLSGVTYQSAKAYSSQVLTYGLVSCWTKPSSLLAVSFQVNTGAVLIVLT